jgi:hypothetical protein
MKKFHALLNHLNRKLNLPQPTKSRVLLEIANDLEDTFTFYKNEGLSDEEALNKAQEKFSLDDRTITEIEHIHRSLLNRWLESISERTRITWERILLICLTLMVVISGLYSSIHQAALFHTGNYAYILIILFSMAILLSIQKFYQLYLKKDHLLSRLRNNLSILLFLSSLSLVSGFFTYYLELFISGSYVFILETKMLAAIFPSNPEFIKVMKETIEWTIRSSAIMMLSMLLSIIIALLWFLFMQKVIQIEKNEIAYLLNEQN